MAAPGAGFSCFLCASSCFQLVSERARFGVPSRFWLCEGCGIIHQDPEFRGHWSAERYAGGEYFRNNVRIPPEKLCILRAGDAGERLTWLCGVLGDRLRPGLKLLEVGSADGSFLKAARDRGWEVTGLEPDPQLSRYCRDGLGLRTEAISWEQFVPSAQYDVVASFHVVEHLEAPWKFLQCVRGLLASGGLLYLETPDSLRPSTLRPRWYDWFDAGHVHTYHEAVLARLLEREGFGDIGRDPGCRQLRVACRPGGAPGPVRDLSPFAERVAARLEAFRRHHWWKRWTARVARAVRRRS